MVKDKGNHEGDFVDVAKGNYVFVHDSMGSVECCFVNLYSIVNVCDLVGVYACDNLCIPLMHVCYHAAAGR